MSPKLIALAVIALIIAGLTIALKVQTSRLDACKTEYAGFVAQTKALGDIAQAKTDAEVKRQADILKRAEANSAKAKSDLAATNKRLRDERAGRSAVPAAPAGSAKPQFACFDRSQLEQALQRLDAGVSGLVDEGDQSALRLRLSREWAAEALGK